MEPYCTGTARIKHKASGVIYEIACDELDWQSSSDERQMGPETCYEATVEHPQLGELSWSLWEYPAGVENNRQSDAGGHDIVEDFEYGLDYVKEPDDWIDYDPPNDPHSIFLDSYRQTKAMLVQHDEDSGLDLLNRMLFTQYITALEAYLGDTLIKSVFPISNGELRAHCEFALLAGHLLRDLKAAAVLQIIRDPGRPEAVTADLGLNPGLPAMPANHFMNR